LSTAVAAVEHTHALVDRADALMTLAEVLSLAGERDQARILGQQAGIAYDAKGHVVGAARVAALEDRLDRR
jgi:hypothetical protein